jgi:hypothetical protein
MHRVYNSAFMHMLRDEDNAGYRRVLKETLEFDPEILKRYVNFMNNPDERTAVDQFGKGDKYFGICTMMATMPGLPMFGHGQVEGFTERYGMGTVAPTTRCDAELVALTGVRSRAPAPPRALRAVRISALRFLHRRRRVNEDVFAYSNRRDGERALVVYRNRYAQTRSDPDVVCLAEAGRRRSTAGPASAGRGPWPVRDLRSSSSTAA